MGKIGLNGFKVFAPIGVSEEERLIGRTLIINIEINYPIEKAGKSDKLEDTLDYGVLCQIVNKLTTNNFNLLEALASAIATEVKNQFKDCGAIKIRIEKEHPFLKGVISNSFIEWESES